MTMSITIEIRPLYEDLIKEKITEYIASNEFTRQCVNLNISDILSLARIDENKRVAQDKSIFNFLEKIDFSNVLAATLNKLYETKKEEFSFIIIEILIAYINWTPHYISIENIILDLRSIGCTDELENKLKNEWTKQDNNILKSIHALKVQLEGMATSGPSDNNEYMYIRSSLMNKASIRPQLPSYIINCRNLGEFWQYIKKEFKTYAERRIFIQDSFAKLLENLENTNHIAEEAIVIDNLYVNEFWQKALTRMTDDAEAAITMARTLVETVCKHILDENEIQYDDWIDLPKLYKQTATTLKLSPDQHTEQIFKQILSGCQSIIDGLGSLRNKLGDAHGKSQSRVRPGLRHATLAVNLAGTMSQFLLQTHIANKELYRST